MTEWIALTRSFTGWTLSDIRDLSHRERKNWLEIAKNYGQIGN